MTLDISESTRATFRAIWEALTDGLPAVITSHVRLDGDGVGCALALRLALRGKGVEARVVLEPPVPANFGFLPGMEEVQTVPDGLPERYNLVVIDCGALERAGALHEALTGRARTINIDHHASNAMFGDVNYVVAGAGSCGEILFGLLTAGGVPLSASLAECLLTAIVSDTGQFAHQDTTPQAYAVAGRCVEAGARPHVVVRGLFCAPTPAQMRLRAMALGTLRFHCDEQVSTMEVTDEMFRATGLAPIDTEGFAELAIGIQGLEAAALLKEMPGCDYIKVSLRSREYVDVAELAGAFGGGGHRHAAGCEIYDSLDAARSAIVAALEPRLRRLPE